MGWLDRWRRGADAPEEVREVRAKKVCEHDYRVKPSPYSPHVPGEWFPDWEAHPKPGITYEKRVLVCAKCFDSTVEKRETRDIDEWGQP